MRRATADASPAPPPLPLETILVYAAPACGIGFMFLLTSTYLMKFATDVLGIPAAAMGAIFFASRVWDALSDPLAGFLSDRTRTRLGRRRPWLLAGALPVGAAFLLMWSPPRLEATLLIGWMGGAVLLFYTGLTLFLVPHDSLGAELSTDYHDRNRIFGVKRIAFGIGTLLVFAAVARLTSSAEPRQDAFAIACVAALGTSVLMLFTGSALRERAAHQGRGARDPRAAFLDLARNPHARLLLAVFFLQQLGVGAIAMTGAYYTEYVFGSAEALPLVLGAFFVAGMLSVPFWLALGRRFDKTQLLLVAMGGVALVIGAVFFVAEGELARLLVLAALGGAAGGGADVLLPSLQADVIDDDEVRTGERKEGVYFAGWNFVGKLSVGVAAVVTGLVLTLSGFDANQPQTPAAKGAIRMLMSVWPFVCYGAGALLFLRFRLDRVAHAAIRARLDERERG